MVAVDEKVWFRDLSIPRQRLVRLMRNINHGRICGLAVKNREPVFDPPPKVVRTVKFPGDNSPRPAVGLQDSPLKAHVHHLLNYLDRIGNGVIEVLEVRDGLPVAGDVEEKLYMR